MTLPRILLIEDEPAIADTLVYALRTEGFTPEWRTTRGEGLEALATLEVALVILDIGLPDGSGLELCKRIRERSTVPALFLTARADELDRVLGLELGADDYVRSPSVPGRSRREPGSHGRRAHQNAPRETTRTLGRHRSHSNPPWARLFRAGGMTIRTRIFLVYLLIVGGGFYYLVNRSLAEPRPRYLESMEEALVDTAHLLASVIENATGEEPIRAETVRNAFHGAFDRRFDASIYSLSKRRPRRSGVPVNAGGPVRVERRRHARERLGVERDERLLPVCRHPGRGGGGCFCGGMAVHSLVRGAFG